MSSSARPAACSITWPAARSILTSCECVVLDEADRMLDIGFRPDIEKILQALPAGAADAAAQRHRAAADRQAGRARTCAIRKTLNFSPKDIAVETIEQFYFTVDPQRKFDLLVRLLEREEPRQAIIFCRTKRGTEKIFQRLSKKLDERRAASTAT